MLLSVPLRGFIVRKTVTEVFLPETIDELWRILDRHKTANVYAGGTDFLVKKLNMLHTSDALVCLERIGGLGGIRVQGSRVFIGATTTHAQLHTHLEIQAAFPILAKAVGVIGSPAIRNMGTIGGNIVTASPAGDSLPALHVLEAEVEIRSSENTRRLPIAEFIRGPGQVDLRAGEIVSGVWLSMSGAFQIQSYEKVGLRNGLACAVASLAALVKLSPKNIIQEIRLAWGSVGPRVVVLPHVQRSMEGRPLTVETMRSAAPMVEQSVSPIDDLRASARYRRMVAASLLLRLAG